MNTNDSIKHFISISFADHGEVDLIRHASLEINHSVKGEHLLDEMSAAYDAFINYVNMIRAQWVDNSPKTKSLIMSDTLDILVEGIAEAVTEIWDFDYWLNEEMYDLAEIIRHRYTTGECIEAIEQMRLEYKHM